MVSGSLNGFFSFDIASPKVPAGIGVGSRKADRARERSE